ncbi:hypothetical protein NITHO_460003 [Nitrolancea hollandica Lb]|uniref:Uncharacterized protein n=1 Tax=Nitrolancea hollandica Lb TaxID=1129897 RepID=I4EKF5_9BACT|nr:hypothetical protein NITHO_460003 [Nitrolancea hollandica Lb]
MRTTRRTSLSACGRFSKVFFGDSPARCSLVPFCCAYRPSDDEVTQVDPEKIGIPYPALLERWLSVTRSRWSGLV